MLFEKNNKKDILFIVIGLIFSFLNITTCTNHSLSSINITLQIIILVYFLFKNEIMQYFLYYLLFITLSFEEGYLFNTKWFGLLNIQIFGVNIAFILMLPLVVYIVFNLKKLKENIHNNANTFKVLLLLLCVYVIAMIMGLINILLNNNLIQSITSYKHLYFSLLYFYGFTVILMFVIFYIINVFDKKNVIIKKYIVLILSILAINVLFTFIFNIKGSYDVYNVLLLPSATFYFSFLCLYGFYTDNKYMKIISIVSVVPLLVYNIFASSGKSILILMFIPIILIYRYFSKNKNVKSFIKFFLAVVFFVGIFIVLINNFSSSNSIFTEKISQIESLMDFSNKNYLMNVSPSPRCRILEIINITKEYIKAPQQLLFGKGFLGTYKDYTGLLKGIGNAYTDIQWESGLFYVPHETFSRLFLMNGLFGIYVMYIILKLMLKSLKNNCWMIIGFLWFIFFYGYSFNLSVLGATFFIIGLIDYDKNLDSNIDICVLDFMFEFGHRTYCNNFANALNKCTSTLFMDSNSYYDFSEDVKHKKIKITTKKVPASNPLITRINMIYNVVKQIHVIYKFKFKKIIISSYEGTILFLFLPFLISSADVCLFHHHQLDELDTSKLKKYLFNKYKNHINHIVVDECIRESLSKEYSIDLNKINVFEIPVLQGNYNIQNRKNEKIFVALSNSNDNNFANDVLAYEKKNGFLKANNIKMIIRTKHDLKDTENITFINRYLSDDEYNNFYANSDVVIIPFPNNFKKRGSATILDALSLKKKVLSTAIPFSIEYSNRYPKSCMIYNNFEEFVNIIENMSYDYDEKEYNRFKNEHSEEVYIEEAKKILEK